MSLTAENLLNEALRLPVSDRGKLVAQLIDSLDSPCDADAEAAWSDEIARRLKEMDGGHSEMVPWSEARRVIRGLDESAAG